MRRVRSTDTTPEKAVRSLLHRLGFRFRLHRRDLPGNPDIVLPKYRTVIFVHGCFWHRHIDCNRASTPTSRREYWLPKFQRTVDRDRCNQEELRRTGWHVIVIWECELKNMEIVSAILPQLIREGPLPLYPESTIKLSVAEASADYTVHRDQRRCRRRFREAE